MFYCNICFCTLSGPEDSRGDVGSAVSGYSSFLSKEVSKQSLKQLTHFFAPIQLAPERPATALADPRPWLYIKSVADSNASPKFPRGIFHSSAMFKIQFWVSSWHEQKNSDLETNIRRQFTLDESFCKSI